MYDATSSKWNRSSHTQICLFSTVKVIGGGGGGVGVQTAVSISQSSVQHKIMQISLQVEQLLLW